VPHALQCRPSHSKGISDGRVDVALQGARLITRFEVEGSPELVVRKTLVQFRVTSVQCVRILRLCGVHSSHRAEQRQGEACRRSHSQCFIRQRLAVACRLVT
jgi:hypothetical protein